MCVITDGGQGVKRTEPGSGIPLECIYCKGSQTLGQVFQVVCGVFLLGDAKTWLDAALSNLPELPLLSREAGSSGVPVCLAASTFSVSLSCSDCMAR